MKKVFIDGSAGTTGLRIRERLSERSDIELLVLSEEKRKDTEARRDAINSADVVFLCLPDDAAREAVAMTENPDTRIIDTSTAHRTAQGWVYGFPELGFEDEIASSHRVANPGCHATGFVSLVYPLVKCGLLPRDALLSCFSLTGYSGGGKKMIAEYEAEGRGELLSSPGIYGLGQNHKHLPEMKVVCGLDNDPVFCPVVDDYLEGMATTVTLHSSMLTSGGLSRVREALSDFYAGQPLVRVASEAECVDTAKIFGAGYAGRDSLLIFPFGTEERFTLTSLFDNLGKGASGAAIQNMNILLGADPTAGLVI